VSTELQHFFNYSFLEMQLYILCSDFMWGLIRKIHLNINGCMVFLLIRYFFSSSDCLFYLPLSQTLGNESMLIFLSLTFNPLSNMICRGVCGAVWFGFKGKSHPNRKIKKHAVWFGSVDFKNKIWTKPNQCGLGWIGWCGFFRDDTILCFQR